MKNSTLHMVLIILLAIAFCILMTHLTEIGRWVDQNVFTEAHSGLQELLQ